ncbi:metallophosphoesterase [Spirosoma areae]
MKTTLSALLLTLFVNSHAVSQAPETLVSRGSSWKYFVNAQPTANWSGVDAFNDSAWPQGNAPLGYSPGNGDGAATPVSNTSKTVYFRKAITLTNVYDYQQFIIRYQRDDGIVLYVNGNEILRDSLPKVPNIITYDTPASLGGSETNWNEYSEDIAHNSLQYFHTGVNIIAAEVHQGTFGTTPDADLRFDFELIGVKVTNPASLSAVTRGPYLQNGTTGQMTIRWRTGTPTRGIVRYGFAPGFLRDFAIEPPATRTNDHSVTLTGLSPNAQYYYSVETLEPTAQVLETSDQHFFRTAPTPGAPQKTRIWVLGDFGTANARQDSATAGYKTFVQNNNIDYVNLWLWLGDNAYGYGVDQQYQSRVFDRGKSRYDWLMRQTPFYATPGNHDFKNGDFPSFRSNHKIHYYDVVSNPSQTPEGGGVASNTPHYYSFNYNNIHFVSLDTYGYEPGETTVFPANSAQLAWLEADLADAQTKPTINWIIVYTHYPPYSMGTKNSDSDLELEKIRVRLVPILHKYKVDLALFGHSHVYERSYLMKSGHTGPEGSFSFAQHTAPVANNGQTSTGTGTPTNCYYFKNSADTENYLVYLVNGAGGAGPETLDNSGKRPHNAMPVFFNKGGSIHIEVDGKRLNSRYVAAGGQVLDDFTIVKDYDGFLVPPTNGSSLAATCECADTQGYTHYTDNKGNLLLSIKKNGITKIGKPGDGTFALTLNAATGGTAVNASAPVNYVRDNPLSENRFWRVSNRYWTLKPAAELVGSEQVSIRQYYKETDRQTLNKLMANAPNDSLGALNPYKINNDNSTYDPNPASGSHATIPKATAFDTKGAWVYDLNKDGLASMFGARWVQMDKENRSVEYTVGRLNGGGGVGGYWGSLNPMGNQRITLSGGNWAYLANGAAPEANSNWKGLPGGGEFIKTNWIYEDKDGKETQDYVSPLGYSPGGINGERTRIPPCASEPCATQWRTTYFRHTIGALCACPQYQYYMLSYRRDGGVVIYINGIERVRENMPTGPVSFSTVPNGATSDKAYWQVYAFPNDGSVLTTGDNIISVEVHRTNELQGPEQSPRLYWDMELIRSPDLLTSSNRLAADPVVVTGVAKNEEPIVVYPMPATKGKVFFTPPLVFETLSLTDLLGRERFRFARAGVISELDVSTLPPGMYILRSQKGDRLNQYKVVVP